MPPSTIKPLLCRNKHRSKRAWREPRSFLAQIHTYTALPSGGVYLTSLLRRVFFEDDFDRRMVLIHVPGMRWE